jgi:hypothetical protein
METMQHLEMLRDGWAKIGQLSCGTHLEPAIEGRRLASAKVNASSP